MANRNLGRVVGNKWYSGTSINQDGISQSGVEYAYTDDMYLNTTTHKVFKCVKGGTEEVAEWQYITALEGEKTPVDDNLTSESTTNALSARQGKILDDLIKEQNTSLSKDIKDLGDAIESEISDINENIDSINENIDSIEEEITNVVSDEWVQRTYQKGEYAISDNKLWKCLVANNVEPSEGSNWTQVKVGNEISQINSNLSDAIIVKTGRWNADIPAGQSNYVLISNSGFFNDIDGYTLVSINICSENLNQILIGATSKDMRVIHQSTGNYDIIISTYNKANYVYSTKLYATNVYIKNSLLKLFT